MSGGSNCGGVVVVMVVVVVAGFNVETDRFVVHKGSRDTKFGFSVSLHRDSNGPWVLVGAPEAETRQEGVIRGGEVFRCHPAHPDDCTPIPLDVTGNHWESGRQMDNKSYQWLGAEVTSRSGVIVACAPRYVWIRPKRREPVGRCFYGTGRDSDGFKMFNPCMASASWGYHQQGSCQAGFGAAITQNGNRMYVGAVGSYYWQGQVFFQDLLSTRDALSTSEAPKQYDMSYLGYSLAPGEFTGDGEEDIAVGMPRGNNLRGQVVIFTHRLQVYYNITGEQLGAYFGYSVASADVNGDGLADVLVGAPWYTLIGNTADYEVGQVTIFTQSPQRNFQVAQRLDGETSRGHFGLAITSLGDLNKDGFQDFAVGAPNAGSTGAGAVYIYLGREGAPSTHPSQVLTSEVLTQGTVRSFGWSLSGGGDLDFNDYPDLVVGAYESDAALVFRTRPVVGINSTLKFRSAKGIIDLEMKGCSLQDGEQVPCVSLLYCLSYDGHRVPSRLSLDVSLAVDTLAPISPRMFFLQRERDNVLNVTVDLRKNVENCTNVYLYVEPEVHDKLTPLVAELVAALGSEVSPGGAAGGLRPVLAPPSHPSAGPPSATIYIKNNCGEDNVCVPDLAVKTYIEQEDYTIGSLENIHIQTQISNSGEDAFQAILRASIPPGLSYASFGVVESSAKDVTPICSYKDTGETEEVVCEVGNPLPAGADVKINLVFQPYPDAINSSSLLFTIESASASEDGDEEDNGMAVALPVTMRSDVDIKGISLPDGAFDYNATRYGRIEGQDRTINFEREIGPLVEHIYDITNGGPSPLPPSTLYLLWPTRTLGNEPLLYLLEEPEISAPASRCTKAGDVNYLGLQLEGASKLTPEAYSETILRRAESEEEIEAEMAINGVNRERENNINKHHHRHHHQHQRRSRRRRRSWEEQVEKELQCGPTNCTRVRCEVRRLQPNQNIVIRVRSRLWIDTIEELGMSEVSISSRVVVVLAGSAGFGGSVGRVWAGSVSSLVTVGPRETTRSLKWLVVAGSILAGLLLLALLSAILWAMGFFKRKRPQDGAESEPLSSNGYYNNGKT